MPLPPVFEPSKRKVRECIQHLQAYVSNNHINGKYAFIPGFDNKECGKKISLVVKRSKNDEKY